MEPETISGEVPWNGWVFAFFWNLRSYFQGRFPGPLLITTYGRGPETRTVFRSCFQGRFSAIFCFVFSRARPERKPSCKLIGGGFGAWNSSFVSHVGIYCRTSKRKPQSIPYAHPTWRQPGAPTLPLKEHPEPRQLKRQKVEPKGSPKR